MTVDPVRMAEIAEQTYLTLVADRFGDDGIKALRRTLETIRELYRYISPENIDGTLVIACPVSGADYQENIVYASRRDKDGSERRYANLAHLAHAYDQDARAAITLVEITDGRLFRLHRNVSAPDYHALSIRSVIYVWSDQCEQFFAGGKSRNVINPTRGVHASVYATPAFRKLEEALDDYRLRFVRRCACPILAEVWETGARLTFVNKPEGKMRKSIAHFLRVALREGVTVAEEQNVDDRHPVDVRLTWHFATRVALIEIKWMGDSRTPSGGLTTYRDARAQKGAQQLAEYLDSQAAQTPGHERTGYLVVIDGRRRHLNSRTISLSLTDAMYYENREIVYQRPHHEMRADFAAPLRMFIEPATAQCMQN